MNCRHFIASMLASTTLGLANVAQAGSAAAFQFCDQTAELSASEQDKLLRFASVVRQAISSTTSNTVIISRSGLNLSRFKIRYSHTAIAWRANPPNSWEARQLYYACEEKRPRIYDQGLAGFVMGTDNPNKGHISIVTLPTEAATSLRHIALNTPSYALRLLANSYSASAYAFGVQYQNCNQWIIELLATAWGNLNNADNLRKQAQTWLREANYRPQPVPVSTWLLLASSFAPLVNVDDHPEEDLQNLALRISLPSSIEAFVQQQYPQSERIEICHNGQQAVVHYGWSPMVEECQPSTPEDRVLPLSTP